MAKLTIKDEDGIERIHELVDEVTTIGRASSSTIPITDSKASRQHFRIEKDDEFFKVVDLGSTNGTKLNGTKITSLRLKLGDVLSVGRTTFTYDGPGPPPSASPVEAGGLNAPAASVELDATVPLDGSDKPSVQGQADAPKYVMAVLEGHESGKIYEMGLEPITIGRHPSNTIRIDDESTSNYHVEIKKEPIGYVISDLGSTNGTRVKTKGAAEFEKIVKTPLSVGVQIRVGKTVFEYRNIGAPAEGDQIFGTVVLDPEKLGDQIAERPKRKREIPTAVIGLLALAIFVGVVFLVIHLVPSGSVENGGNLSPTSSNAFSDPSNRLVNGDFSSGTRDDGTPVGWRPNPGQPGVRIRVDKEAERNAELPEEKKKGLVIHKSGVICRSTVDTEDTFPVDTGKVYEIAGSLKNDGDGLFGLRVTWLKGARKLVEHPVVLVASQEWKERSALVRAPAWADRVRVGVFTEGREGKSYFDNISFREKPQAKVPIPPSVSFAGITLNFEGDKGAFAANASGLPAIEGGTLELVSKDLQTVSSLLSAIDAKLTREGAKTTVVGRLYDFVLERPTSYRIVAHADAEGVVMSVAVNREMDRGSTPRLKFYVVGPPAQGRLEVYKSSGVEPLNATAKARIAGAQEVLFNAGKTPQLYLHFSSPVLFQTRREGRRRLVWISFKGELEMAMAPENVSQKQKVMALLKDLDKALRDKTWGRVWKLAQKIETKNRGQFPEAQDAVSRAREKYEAAFAPVDEELKRQLNLMREFKSAKIAKVVREKIQSMLPPWAGTPHRLDFQNALAEVEAMEKTGVSEQQEAAAQKDLVRAQRSFKVGGDSLFVCISLCKKILRTYPKTKAAEEARELKAKAEKAKKKYDLLMGITDRLKDKVKPYIIAKDYIGAVKIIRAEKQYQDHAHELKEISDLLRAWTQKAQEK